MCELLEAGTYNRLKRFIIMISILMSGSREGGVELPGKSHVAICFLRNTGKDPSEKQCDLLCQNDPNQYTFSVDL